MHFDDEKLQEIILFQINRNVVNLYKQFLFTLEDLKAGKYNLKDPVIYQQLRKRVLDAGNDAYREIEGTIKRLEIKFKSGDNQ